MPFQPLSESGHLLRQGAAVLFLVAIAVSAHAHDTWFEPRPADAGNVALLLGTGNLFPRHEYPIGIEQLRQNGCRQGDAAPRVLARVADLPNALALHAEVDAGLPVTCWAQLMPFEVELAPDKVRQYFRDIHPPQAVRDAWADISARGLPWKERYTKHSRIELPAPVAAQNPTALRPKPVAMGMDALLESGLQTVHVGDPLVFQVLRDGVPLPGFAVELRSDRSGFGIWRQTDAEGRVRIAAPLAGRWVLRGTDLRLSDSRPDTWESRFINLAFEVVAAPLPTMADAMPDAQPAVASAAH